MYLVRPGEWGQKVKKSKSQKVKKMVEKEGGG
jgi:hypothetical protein